MAWTGVTRARTRLFAVAGGLVLAAGTVLTASSPASANERELAEATLRLADGSQVGTAVFFGVNKTVTRVRVALDMPPGRPMPGFHGFHVHANDDPANGSGCLADATQPSSTWFVSADGHLAEEGQGHGAHVGDLPPLLLTEKGRAYSISITDRLRVEDVVGAAVMMHAGLDNLGNIPVGEGATQYTPNSPEATALTVETGNAGDRVACGVIGLR